MKNTNKKIDLHIHSSFSEDADLSVNEIFKSATEASIAVISITDHDSIQSIGEALVIKEQYPVEYIPGVEITTVFPADGSQQHILGYYVDPGNTGINEIIEKITDFRKIVARERIDALRNINFTLDEANILKTTGDRPISAVSIMLEILTNKNNLNDPRLEVYLRGEKKNDKIRHFYRDYLLEGKPAYVPFRSISCSEGIDTIKAAGGVPVLAHPVFVKKTEFLDDLKEMGLGGIEAVSTYHKPKETAFYLEYASKNDLLITAGSDFHGKTSKPDIKLGEQEGMYYSYFEKLKEYHLKNE